LPTLFEGDEVIELTDDELFVAGVIGTGRNIQAGRRDWKVRGDRDDAQPFEANIQGAAGEIAVAKAIDHEYIGIIGDPDADDVGPYQVRTNMSHSRSDLYLKETDRDDRIFIGARAFTPFYIVTGWVWGDEGKRIHTHKAGRPGWRECMYVPNRLLRPIALLPRLYDKHRPYSEKIEIEDRLTGTKYRRSESGLLLPVEMISTRTIETKKESPAAVDRQQRGWKGQ